MRGVLPTDTGSATAEAGPATVRRESWLTRERALDWGTGVLVLVVYAVVRLWLLRGPMPYDPAKYFDTAVDFSDVAADLWTLRIGLVVPVRAAVLVFGPSEAAFYAVPIAAGLVLAAAVYATMLLLFDDRVLGAAAALVTVLNTEYMLNSSQIYPDVAAAATLTLGFLCLVLGSRRSEGRTEGWATTAAAGFAGLLFGWTYLIREFSLILIPAVLAAALLLRYSLRRFSILAGAALAMFGVELFYGFVRYEDPFTHARGLLARSDIAVPPVLAARIESVQEQLDSVLDTLQVFPRLLLTWNTGWIFLLLLALFLAALVVVRDRRLWILGVWCFSYWAIMAVLGLGSLSSGRWIVNVTNVRYWYPIFPALVMGAFGGLALLLQRWSPALRGVWVGNALAGVLAAAVVVPGLVEYRQCAVEDVWRNDPAGRWHDLRSWLALPEAGRYDSVWTDHVTERLVPAFTSTMLGQPLWPGEVRIFPGEGSLARNVDRRRSLILIHKDRFRWAVPRPDIRLQELRREWAPVFTSGDGRMVLLAYAPGETSDGGRGNGAWWDLASNRAPAGEPGRCGRSPYEPASRRT
jgi:hypothetical protein